VATIKLTSLIDSPPKTYDNWRYTDLHLDFNPVYKRAPFGQFTRNNEVLREGEIVDIAVDHDLGAIKNSLVNLFLTIPGQKILNPYFGINLLRYLFEPCSVSIADLIGNEIVAGITKFEPRVILQKVRVIADPENNQYIITIIISIPTVDTGSLQLVGKLSTSGFVFVS